MRKNIEKCNRFGGPKIDPFWGHGSIKKKNTNPEADPKTGQFLDHQNGDVFFNILRKRYFPLAFCYGCCIFTCLLIETGAGLVLVARQQQFNAPCRRGTVPRLHGAVEVLLTGETQALQQSTGM